MLPIDPAQTRTPLLEALRQCVQRQDTPFYTPGHKHGRSIPPALSDLLGTAVFHADLPELPDLDNLFAPQAAIQAAQELAATAFEADRTWFLVNGSTCGVIAAILATCGMGEKILLPRNCHQSAIAGLILSGAVPIFLAPAYDAALDLAHSPTVETVAAALTAHPDAKAILLTYPTYFGVGGDIAAIAQLAHQHDIPLLVDEAHGAHFAFHPDLPMSALAAGADLSVQSTHKTLSAMTQAAMVHLRGDRVKGDRISRALQLVQSTSPSYLLLASLDAARQQMATQGKFLLEQTLQLADSARDRISQIPGLSVLQPEQAGTPGFWTLDRTRLTVTVANLGMDGFTADDRLRQQFNVTAELPSLRHLTFILSIGNTAADIDQLVHALTHLAKNQLATPQNPPLPPTLYPLPSTHPPLITPRQAHFAPTEILPIAQAIDRLSAELICPYPPGIPLLMPGEVITTSAIAQLQQVLALGSMISGCADPTLETITVLRS